MNQDKYQACLIGSALGDALCAPYEGGPIERFLWRFFSHTKNNKIRYTDDTQMTIDIAQSLIKNKSIQQDDIAKRFAASYRWSRGYGPSAAKILKKIKKGGDWNTLNTSQFKEGSFGNGAAMRIAPIALMYPENHTALKKAVIDSSLITHAHPLAIDGAINCATTLSLVLHDQSNAKILQTLTDNNHEDYKAKISIAQDWLLNRKSISEKQVIHHLGNSIEAINSTITAIYLGLRFRNHSYLPMIKFIQNVGGDTDTIAAMAGAIWGAANSMEKLKHPKLEQLESKQQILDLADSLFLIRSC